MAAVNLARKLTGVSRKPDEDAQDEAVPEPEVPSLGERIRPFLPSPRDLHLYGGGFLMGLGIGLWIGVPQAIVAFAVYIVLLGRPWR